VKPAHLFDLVSRHAPREEQARRIAWLSNRASRVDCLFYGSVTQPGGRPTGHNLYRKLGTQLQTLYRHPYDLEQLEPSCLWNGWSGDTNRDCTPGPACLTHRNDPRHGGGWSIIGFYDQSGDQRLGACSFFCVAYPNLRYDAVVRVSKYHWPEIWDRLNFEVYQVTQLGHRVY